MNFFIDPPHNKSLQRTFKDAAEFGRYANTFI